MSPLMSDSLAGVVGAAPALLPPPSSSEPQAARAVTMATAATPDSNRLRSTTYLFLGVAPDPSSEPVGKCGGSAAHVAPGGDASLQQVHQLDERHGKDGEDDQGRVEHRGVEPVAGAVEQEAQPVAAPAQQFTDQHADQAAGDALVDARDHEGQ